jgi:superfamily I DNA/RNA helicase
MPCSVVVWNSSLEKSHGLSNTGYDLRRVTLMLNESVEAEFPLIEARNLVFDVYAKYLALRNAAGKDFDWDDMANAVCDELDKDGSRRRYKHVVIDEGQDFSPQMIRSLAKAIPPDGSLRA